jgi:iron(III) transport system permease protein
LVPEGFNLSSPWGVAALLALLTWPLTALLSLAAWARLEAAPLESDPGLRGGALVRWLLWPRARGAVGQAALLTFVLALNQFAVPVILQVPVYPEELWLALTTRLDARGAWAAAVPLVVAPLGLLLLGRHQAWAWPHAAGAGAAAALRRQLGPGLRSACAGVTAALLALSLGIPLLQLAGSARTWTELSKLLQAAPGAVWHSAAYAAGAATAAVAAAAWLTAGRRRGLGWLWLLFLIPGMLLGQALLLGFQHTPLAGTTALVLVAFTLRYLPLGRAGLDLARREADPALLDAARLDGARGWALFRHGLWPQVAPQAAATWYAIYLLGLWEVETLVFLQPPGGETLALRAFNLLHYGHTAQVNAICLVLLGLAVAPLALWTGLAGVGSWVQRRRTHLAGG